MAMAPQMSQRAGPSARGGNTSARSSAVYEAVIATTMDRQSNGNRRNQSEPSPGHSLTPGVCFPAAVSIYLRANGGLLLATANV